jgi:indolepyruvate decarboxylase
MLGLKLTRTSYRTCSSRSALHSDLRHLVLVHSTKRNLLKEAQLTTDTEAARPYTVATYLVARLAELGVEHLFNVPGSYCGGLLKALPQEGLVTAVLTTNEQESGYAADAYSRIKGHGALCGTYGVGMFGVVNAIAGAYVERCAVVVINGGPTDKQINEEVNHGVLFLHSIGRMRTDYEVFRNITVAAEIIRNAEEAPKKIDSVLEACILQHRPVYIEINKELWDKPCTSPSAMLSPSPIKSNPEALAEAVADAMARLQTARCPIIWGGEEVARWGLHNTFRSLVDTSHLPYATTLMGKGLLSEEHEQFIGVYDGRFAPPETREIVGRTDCTLALGTSIADFIGDIVARDYGSMILASAGGVRIGYHLYSGITLEDFMTTLKDALVSAKYVPPQSAKHLARRPTGVAR